MPIATFKSRQQCLEVGAGGRKKGSEMGVTNYRAVLPKGLLLLQDTSRRPEQKLPRKIPVMLVYSNMVETLGIVGIIAKSSASPGRRDIFQLFCSLPLTLFLLLQIFQSLNLSSHIPSFIIFCSPGLWYSGISPRRIGQSVGYSHRQTLSASLIHSSVYSFIHSSFQQTFDDIFPT